MTQQTTDGRSAVRPLPFAASEFEDRLERVSAAMRERGLDALVVVRPENIFYVTGYRAAHIAQRTSELHAVVLVPGRKPWLVARLLERETARTQWAEPLLFADHESPYDLVRQVLGDAGGSLATIGIEDRFLRVRQFDELRQRFPSVTFSDASGLVERVAARLSLAEIDSLHRSAEITALGLRTGLGAIREGGHAYEVIGSIHESMYRAGQSDFDKSLVAVWSGPQGGLMHDTLTTQQFVDGDVATVEIMGVDRHYRTGAQACVYVGPRPPKEIVDAHALVVEMHERARGAVRAGVTADEVFEAANAAYRRVRGVDYYRRVGGSMGLTNFTLDLVRGRRDELTAGVPLLIQTLVDDPVLITCASTVIVTEDGFTELTEPVLDLRTAH